MEQRTRSRDVYAALCEFVAGTAPPHQRSVDFPGKLRFFLAQIAKKLRPAETIGHAAAMTALRVKHPTYSRATLHRARIAITRGGTITDQNATLDAGATDGEGHYELRLRTVRVLNSGERGMVDFPSFPLDQQAVNKIQETLDGDRLHGMGFKFSLELE